MTVALPDNSVFAWVTNSGVGWQVALRLSRTLRITLAQLGYVRIMLPGRRGLKAFTRPACHFSNVAVRLRSGRAGAPPVIGMLAGLFPSLTPRP